MKNTESSKDSNASDDQSYLMDADDVAELINSVHGNFATDPLMHYAVACSPEVKPEVKELYLYEIEKNRQKGQANVTRMMKQCGVKRLGSIEEQENMVNRQLSCKRELSESEEEQPGHK